MDWLTLKYAACHGINEEARNANVNPKTTGWKRARMPDWQEEILFQWVSQSYQFLPTFRKYIFIISFTFDYSFCNWDLGAVWIAALPGTGRYVTANQFFTNFCARIQFLVDWRKHARNSSSIFWIFTLDSINDTLFTISSFTPNTFSS